MSLTLNQIVDIASTNTEFSPANTTNDVYFAGETNERLTDVLGTIAAEVIDKAEADHTHDYAAANHTHSGYAVSSHAHSIGNITGLETLLLNAQEEIDGKAPATHTHTPASIGAAAASHTHDYATSNHGHSYNDLSDKPTIPAAYTHPSSHPASMITGLSEVATTGSYNDLTNKPTIPTVPSSLPANGGNADTVDNKHASDFAEANHSHTASEVGAAAASHTHTGFAASGHTHTASDVGAAAASHTHTPASIGAAASSHTHSGYAASSHTHTGYASSSHTHTASDVGAASSSHSHTAADVGALPASGGTVTGATTFNSDVTIKGKNYTQQMLPFDGGSYSIGSSDNRYYSTYLRVNPNVSSDLRCKRDIVTMDIEALAAFVDKLAVVSYNYNDDKPEEAKRIGLIAQDVVAADPTIAKGCIEQDEKGFYSLRAADLVFPLIAAVQSLAKRVEELENSIK